MAEGHGIGSPDSSHRHTRRAVLGAAASVGVLGSAAPAALAARAGAGRPDPARPADTITRAEQAAGTPGVAAVAPGTGELWGTSRTGHGAGVRGNGRSGVVGEGTHTGVSGAGFVGVLGATSIVRGDNAGVGVWAQAMLPGSTALRADGPSEFNGVTTFSRSGVVTVPRGSKSVTVTGVSLTAETAILATLQNRVNGLYLHAVETDAANGSLTIFLSAASDHDIRVGWLALG
jgi:hypothetical protein